jgi:hypothetical protein
MIRSLQYQRQKKLTRGRNGLRRGANAALDLITVAPMTVAGAIALLDSLRGLRWSAISKSDSRIGFAAMMIRRSTTSLPAMLRARCKGFAACDPNRSLCARRTLRLAYQPRQLGDVGAMRRVSSRVSRFAAARRPGSYDEARAVVLLNRPGRREVANGHHRWLRRPPLSAGRASDARRLTVRRSDNASPPSHNSQRV